MNLLGGWSDVQVKKAVSILLGVVIKDKMNGSYLYLWKRNTEDNLQAKNLFIFKWSPVLQYIRKYKVRVQVSLVCEVRCGYLKESPNKILRNSTDLIFLWKKPEKIISLVSKLEKALELKENLKLLHG